MIKAVCMFRLADGINEEEFEKFFKKHVEDAKKLKNLKKYTIAKKVDKNDKENFFRVNELYYDSAKDADESFSTDLAKEATEELLGWVKDFNCVIVSEEIVL